MKLISDFDGIWTEQDKEAEYVWNYIIASVSDLSEMKLSDVDKFFIDCKAFMSCNPEKYGWINNRMTAAFFGEDPYGDNNAIFGCVDKLAVNYPNDNLVERAKMIRESILRKFGSLSEYSQECFTAATGKYKSEGKLKAITSAKEIVKKLNAMDTEIVVASNSTTQKIEYLFRNAGVATDGKIVKGGASIRARGDAKKFVLYNSYSVLPVDSEINERIKVPLRRASYHQILIEEKPDFVIGDVFSLDIALPLHLRMHDKKNFGNLKVVQRLQPYTPKWVSSYLKQSKFKNIAFTVKSVNELPGIIKKFI